MTEMRVAYELVDRGIPKEDIVLGFQFPALRQYTDFAIAYSNCCDRFVRILELPQ